MTQKTAARNRVKKVNRQIILHFLMWCAVGLAAIALAIAVGVSR